VTESVVVATVTTFGVILTALLSYLGVVTTGARRHAKAALNEVRNSHDTNLRDDLDAKFDGLAQRLVVLTNDVGGIKEDIRIIHRGQESDRLALAVERDRIRNLEDTRPPRRKA
jgi:Protein of unknown function (DUF2746)